MARTRDKTDEFKEAVRTIASAQGFDEVKMAKVSASLILRKPRPKSPFIEGALKTLESIQTLQDFVLNHRKDYTDQHRTTEQDRDNIEHEAISSVYAVDDRVAIPKHCWVKSAWKVFSYVAQETMHLMYSNAAASYEIGVFVKACREQIDILKNNIEIEDKKGETMTWLGSRGAVANADIIAHKHGVVLILSERLHAVTAVFDQLRAARFREAIDKTIPRRMQPLQSKSSSLETSATHGPTNSGVMQQDVPGETIGIRQQLLDAETQALQVELTNLLDTVQETEAKMVEMSALNHLFSTHVLQQAQQIECLYEQAIEATQNVQKGNKELAKAIERNSSSRTFLLLFLVVLPLSLLFLDWYQ